MNVSFVCFARVYINKGNLLRNGKQKCNYFSKLELLDCVKFATFHHAWRSNLFRLNNAHWHILDCCDQHTKLKIKSPLLKLICLSLLYIMLYMNDLHSSNEVSEMEKSIEGLRHLILKGTLQFCSEVSEDALVPILPWFFSSFTPHELTLVKYTTKIFPNTSDI